MITAVISPAISPVVTGAVTVVGCVVFVVITELTDENRWPALAHINRYFTVYLIPLLFLFAYLAIVWAARIMFR